MDEATLCQSIWIQLEQRVLKRLRAVENCEKALSLNGPETAAMQIAHEIPAYFRVLARTDSKAQHMLGAASIDSDCSHAAQPVAKVDPVEHHHQDIEFGEIAPQDLVDKSLGLSRPQSADSAFGKPLQLAFVQPLRKIEWIRRKAPP